MTSSIIATDAALRPCCPLALHVYKPASAFLTVVNVRVPLYFPFPKERVNEFEGLTIRTPFLNHSNVTGVCIRRNCDASHSKAAGSPS